MRTVGRKIVREPALRPSAELLRTAATINDTLKAILPGGRTCVPKGVYRYRTLEEANHQQAEWLAQAMAENREGLLRTKQSARGQDVTDRMAIERALAAARSEKDRK